MANLAINGGTPVRTEPYPSWPTFDDSDLKSFEEIYRSGVWGTNGSRVPEFEERFAQFQGAKYGVCVNSGTAALYVALKAAGVGAWRRGYHNAIYLPSDGGVNSDGEWNAGVCRYAPRRF